MDKGGRVSGSGGSGPTAAAAVIRRCRGASSSEAETLLQRVETDIGNVVDNFSHLINVARVNDPPVRNTQEFFMEMRAARMVQASYSLLKLVFELKQTAIFSGFASLNDHINQRSKELNQLAEKSDHMLATIGEEAAASLKEMETHYCSSTTPSRS